MDQLDFLDRLIFWTDFASNLISLSGMFERWSNQSHYFDTKSDWFQWWLKLSFMIFSWFRVFSGFSICFLKKIWGCQLDLGFLLFFQVVRERISGFSWLLGFLFRFFSWLLSFFFQDFQLVFWEFFGVVSWVLGLFKFVMPAGCFRWPARKYQVLVGF